MRSASAVLVTMGMLVAPLSSAASTITGSGPYEVSSTVGDSLAGSNAVPGDETRPREEQQRHDSAPDTVVAVGMPLADLGGLPMMLVSPPQFYEIGAHGKLRSLAAELDNQDSSGGGGGGLANVSPQVGNGNGGLSNVSSVGSAPQVIPEPLTIVLAAPALLLAIRRRIKR